MTVIPSNASATLDQTPGEEVSVPVYRPSDWMFLQPAILDQMHDSIIATDLDGMVTGCNRAAEHMFGYRPDELIGQNVELLYVDDERHLLKDVVNPAVLATGEFRGEMRKRTRSGEVTWIHLSIQLLKDADGEPAGMVRFSVDVTSRKLGELAVIRNDVVERELKIAREESATMKLLTSAIERSQDVFLIAEAEPIDLPGPRIQYVNPAFEKLTGYTAAEVIGKTPRILQGPKTERAALDRIRAALKSWQPVREELTNYRKDGTEFTVELSIVPIANEQGWYTHWFAIQRDMTEQKLLRDELLEGEARLHFLTEAMPQLLWTASADGMCQFVSQSCAQFLGVRQEICYGAGWYKFVHPEDMERVSTVWRDSIFAGQTFVTEYRLRRHDGEYLWFLHRAAPRHDATGKVVEWIGSSTDIEQQKRSEEAIRQTEKLAAVGRLASSIAHEINNPLTSVTNLLFLLSNQPNLSNTAKEYVRTAQEELLRVSEITTQTLRFHKQQTFATQARVAEILDSVLAFFRPRLRSGKLQVRREYASTEQLVCYSADLRQAFTNLIANAIEASSEGGRLRIRLRTSLSWKRRQRPGIRVTIGDSGHGMTPEVMRRIFEPFYTTKGITGTGLGLWITKDLLSKHDASISLRSSARAGSSGTVISVFLPFAPRSAEQRLANK